MAEKQKAVELAAKLLKLTETEADEYCHELAEAGAWYFSVPVRGGDSLIVGPDMTVLYANSSVSFELHVSEFKKGTRTPIELFEQ